MTASDPLMVRAIKPESDIREWMDQSLWSVCWSVCVCVS